MRAKPWDVPDGLWERVEPLLPTKPRRFRYPGRRPFDDRLALQGILFVLHTGIGWEHLPQELGFGCGMTAWRRLRASGIRLPSYPRRPPAAIGVDGPRLAAALLIPLAPGELTRLFGCFKTLSTPSQDSMKGESNHVS